jgi:hopanoid biosynthesis associated protein HpnK
VRRLIVNADDFGLTSGVNRGIIEAQTRGIVTSATLMACGPKFQEAVGLAVQTPSLSVGCHVLLVDACPVLELQQVSSLALANSGQPQFRESIVSFACLAATRRLSEEQIEAEITAQILKLQSAGVQVSHLDSHKHTHMFPVVFKPMLRAAKKCGVRAIRNPFEPLLFARTRLWNWKRSFQLGILRSFRSSFRRALNQAGMITPDGCVGIVSTGGLNAEVFRALVKNLPEGTWEFVSHPGYNDAELGKIKTRLRRSREKELAILTSAEVKQLLRRERIELISYRDFVLSSNNLPRVVAPSGAQQ